MFYWSYFVLILLIVSASSAFVWCRSRRNCRWQNVYFQAVSYRKLFTTKPISDRTISFICPSRIKIFKGSGLFFNFFSVIYFFSLSASLNVIIILGLSRTNKNWNPKYWEPVSGTNSGNLLSNFRNLFLKRRNRFSKPSIRFQKPVSGM